MLPITFLLAGSGNLIVIICQLQINKHDKFFGDGIWIVDVLHCTLFAFSSLSFFNQECSLHYIIEIESFK
jgi:hypothetical protein